MRQSQKWNLMSQVRWQASFPQNVDVSLRLACAIHICVTFLPSSQQNFKRTRCSSSSFIVTFSLIPRTAYAHDEFSGCSSTTNSPSETGQMAVCFQNLPLGALSSRSASSVLVGALFKKFGLFFLTRLIRSPKAPKTPTKCFKDSVSCRSEWQSATC
jgi:hypothetical protein